MNDIEHPRHYNSHPSGVECIDVNEYMTANMAAAFKYLMRWEHKGLKAENLKKAAFYMRREVNRKSAVVLRIPFEAYEKAEKIIFHETDPIIKSAMKAIVEWHLARGCEIEIMRRAYEAIEAKAEGIKE